jgi:DNA repair exonuclease SbcCD ATPase subunit
MLLFKALNPYSSDIDMRLFLCSIQWGNDDNEIIDISQDVLKLQMRNMDDEIDMLQQRMSNFQQQSDKLRTGIETSQPILSDLTRPLEERAIMLDRLRSTYDKAESALSKLEDAADASRSVVDGYQLSELPEDVYTKIINAINAFDTARDEAIDALDDMRLFFEESRFVVHDSTGIFAYPTIAIDNLQDKTSTVSNKISALQDAISNVQSAVGAAYKVEHLTESLSRSAVYFADGRGGLDAVQYLWQRANR